MKIFREVLVIFGLYYVGELISTTIVPAASRKSGRYDSAVCAAAAAYC